MAGRPKSRGRTEKPPAGGPGHGPPKGAGHGPPKGAGWGGPANGTMAEQRAAKKAALIDGPPGDDLHTRYLADDEPRGEDRLALKRRRSLEMEKIIYDIARAGQHESTRQQAAQKMHELYNGKPIERVIVDEQPIQHDTIDPAELSPEAREELRATLERQKHKGVH